MGKGGVGKSTVAAALALAAARRRQRVLVVSFDIGHSVAEIFGVATGAKVVPVTENVDVLRIDPTAVVDDLYRSVHRMLAPAAAHHRLGVRVPDPRELIVAPGAADLASLDRLAGCVADDRWDLVILDAPPTQQWLTLVAVPEAVVGYLEGIWPQHLRVAAGVGTDVRAIVLVAVLEQIKKAADRVVAMLARAEAVLVTTGERAARSESAILASAAGLYGMTLRGAVINRVLPNLSGASVPLVGAHPAVFWYEAIRTDRSHGLDPERAGRHFAEVVSLELSAYEPVGLALLEPLADRLVPLAEPAGDGPGAGGITVRLVSGSGLESRYAMCIPLPMVDSPSLRVGRVEDEVIVSAGEIRRRIRLASVLRRCRVDGAHFADGMLEIYFRPDPQVWPT
nr:ArsA family ATPase [Millisia brevis]